ncbi:hypothetical protein EDD21DRAFT_391797 [Dissophora ornata]|nr:hypothetical protein EDD21DRAFT_391797 [Dissophora ornata]
MNMERGVMVSFVVVDGVLCGMVVVISSRNASLPLPVVFLQQPDNLISLRSGRLSQTDEKLTVQGPGWLHTLI